MSALVKINGNLADIEKAIDDAELRGVRAWADLARLVAAVYHGELWRQAKVPIGRGTKEKRPCESFVEWIVVCREKQKSWGYQLVKAAAFSAVAENEKQARELIGLSAADAEALVDLATDGGKKATTAEELRRLRAEDAIAKVKGDRGDVQRQLKRMRSDDWLKAVRTWANKGRKLFQREVGTDGAEALINQLVELAEGIAA